MAESSQAQRIKSILALHALLAGPVLSGIDPEIHYDISKLLNFDEKPEKEKIERVKSLVRLYSILFAQGLVSISPEIDEELDSLLAYLDSLIPHSNFVLKRSAFIPRNLGLISRRKGLALPLFGYNRPEYPPTGQSTDKALTSGKTFTNTARSGLLLCYQSIEAGEVGLLEFVSLNEKTNVSYENLGCKIETKNPWLFVRIGKRGHDPHVTLSNPFPKGKTKNFINERYELFIPDRLARGYGVNLFDPFEFRYVYYFEKNALANQRLGAFLRDLLSTMYGFTRQAVEIIADTIIGHL